MQQTAPIFANGFAMAPGANVTELSFSFTIAGQPMETGVPVAHLEIETSFARQIATMILAETDPGKLAARDAFIAEQRKQTEEAAAAARAPEKRVDPA